MSITRPLAVVTGASSGIGYELARLCAEHGYDLAVAADEPSITEAQQVFQGLGADVTAICTDLSTEEGVDERYVSRALLAIVIALRRVHQSCKHVDHRADQEERAKRIHLSGRFDPRQRCGEEGVPQSLLDVAPESELPADGCV